MILAFIQRYLTAGLAFLALTGFFYGGIQTYRLQGLKLKNAEATQKAEQAARNKEAEWSIIYKETTDAKQTELRSVAAERDSALLSLRNRPRERLPETPANCAGSSPAALSSNDAEAFVRLAASADDLRAEYAACKSYVEMIGR